MGPIFASERDGHALKGTKHWFEDGVREAGLHAAGIDNFTWHCLRHTFASRLSMSGIDLRTIAELLGHKSISMTMRYAHLAPSHKQMAVEKLAEFNRREKQAPAILNAPENGTETGQKSGTRTGTGAISEPLVEAKSVQ